MGAPTLVQVAEGLSAFIVAMFVLVIMFSIAWYCADPNCRPVVCDSKPVTVTTTNHADQV